MYNKSFREKAYEMREKGYSYSFIKEKVPVSKSTLSEWLSGISFIPNKEVIDKIGKARAASALVKSRLKLKSISDAREQSKIDIGQLTRRDIFMLGIALYLGEGSKGDTVRIVNGNPLIIKFMIKWFVVVCGMTMKHFVIRLHIYPDNDISACIRYWSKATRVPVTQFQKTQVDLRSDKKRAKKGKLPYGTAHMTIKSLGRKDWGVYLARRIDGWMKEVLK